MAVWNVINLGEFLDFRFDAECYQPQLLEVERRVQSLRPVALDTVATVTDGNHVSIAGEFCESGIRYLKGQEVSDFFIDDSNPTFIPESTYQNITRAHMSEGDILLSVIGTIGPVALVTNKYEELCGSCKLAIIRPYSINSSILAAYLSSETGQALLRRRIRGSVQPGITLPDIRTFPVPPFTDALVEHVDGLIKEAQTNLTQAESFYPEAETEMLERMGWSELEGVPRELSYIADFNTLETKGRIDPEFFHPLYARLRAQISERGGILLGSINRPNEQIRRGVQPQYTDEGVLVINSRHLGPTQIDYASAEHTSLEFYNSDEAETARINRNDVLIYSTGAYVGRTNTYLIDEPAIASNHVAIVRPQEDICNSIYLALFLNSPAGRLQSEQFSTGSAQRELYPSHISQLQVFVPRRDNGKVDLEWQLALADKVLEANRAKDRTREKLEEAIQLVEKAIT